jgi:hypothetical protein
MNHDRWPIRHIVFGAALFALIAQNCTGSLLFAFSATICHA